MSGATGRMRSALQLEWRFRLALYAAFALLVATGAAWLIADRLKDAPAGDAREVWQQTAAWLLMIHGGGAMVGLLLLGALIPAHAMRAWRARRNRITGTAMASINTALIATGFGLYYFGSEMLRPLASGMHTAAGFILPALIVIHVLFGRRGRKRNSAGIRPADRVLTCIDSNLRRSDVCSSTGESVTSSM